MHIRRNSTNKYDVSLFYTAKNALCIMFWVRVEALCTCRPFVWKLRNVPGFSKRCQHFSTRCQHFPTRSQFLLCDRKFGLKPFIGCISASACLKVEVSKVLKPGNTILVNFNDVSNMTILHNHRFLPLPL